MNRNDSMPITAFSLDWDKSIPETPQVLCNVISNDTEYIVTIELPGIHKKY